MGDDPVSDRPAASDVVSPLLSARREARVARILLREVEDSEVLVGEAILRGFAALQEVAVGLGLGLPFPGEVGDGSRVDAGSAPWSRWRSRRRESARRALADMQSDAATKPAGVSRAPASRSDLITLLESYERNLAYLEQVLALRDRRSLVRKLVMGLAVVAALAVVWGAGHVFGPDRPWRVTIFKQPDFSGTSVTRRHQNLQFEWHDRGPVWWVKHDPFSVRAESCLRVIGEPVVQLSLSSDDGSRVSIDGAVVVDNWRAKGLKAESALVRLNEGLHVVRVDYFDDQGDARLHFDWKQHSGGLEALSWSYPSTADDAAPCGVAIAPIPPLVKRSGFLARYYPTVDFGGEPVIGSAVAIDQDFGERAPVPGIPADRFSIRWDACFDLAAAEEISFALSSDDGSRLFLDGRLVLDHWGEHGLDTRSTKASVASGRHHLRVEYFDAVASALVRFTIDRGPGSTDTLAFERPEGDESTWCRSGGDFSPAAAPTP